MNKLLHNERLSFADGVTLFKHANLPKIGVLADFVHRSKHPNPTVTYVIGRNINY